MKSNSKKFNRTTAIDAKPAGLKVHCEAPLTDEYCPLLQGTQLARPKL
jgi:hypothetical protein